MAFDPATGNLESASFTLYYNGGSSWIVPNASTSSNFGSFDVGETSGGSSEILLPPGDAFFMDGPTTNGVYCTFAWNNGESSLGSPFLSAGQGTSGYPINNIFQSAPAPLDSFGLPTGGDWIIATAPLPPGDANGDGQVDINDLTIVLANFGLTGAVWSQGEFTGSGTVDINDLTIALANYGYGVSAAGLKAVPEPSCIVLLGIAVVGLAACACRRRR